jgi:hypothetical protein
MEAAVLEMDVVKPGHKEPAGGPSRHKAPQDSKRYLRSRRLATLLVAVELLLVFYTLYGTFQHLRETFPEFSEEDSNTTFGESECEAIAKINEGLDASQRFQESGDVALVCPADGPLFCPAQCCDACTESCEGCTDEPWQSLECCPPRDELFAEDDETRLINFVFGCLEFLFTLVVVGLQLKVLWRSKYKVLLRGSVLCRYWSRLRAWIRGCIDPLSRHRTDMKKLSQAYYVNKYEGEQIEGGAAEVDEEMYSSDIKQRAEEAAQSVFNAVGEAIEAGSLNESSDLEEVTGDFLDKDILFEAYEQSPTRWLWWLCAVFTIYELGIVLGFLVHLAKGKSSLLCFACDFRKKYHEVARLLEAIRSSGLQEKPTNAAVVIITTFFVDLNCGPNGPGHSANMGGARVKTDPPKPDPPKPDPPKPDPPKPDPPKPDPPKPDPPKPDPPKPDPPKPDPPKPDPPKPDPPKPDPPKPEPPEPEPPKPLPVPSGPLPLPVVTIPQPDVVMRVDRVYSDVNEWPDQRFSLSVHSDRPRSIQVPSAGSLGSLAEDQQADVAVRHAIKSQQQQQMSVPHPESEPAVPGLAKPKSLEEIAASLDMNLQPAFWAFLVHGPELLEAFHWQTEQFGFGDSFESETHREDTNPSKPSSLFPQRWLRARGNIVKHVDTESKTRTLARKGRSQFDVGWGLRQREIFLQLVKDSEQSGQPLFFGLLDAICDCPDKCTV